MSRQQRRQETAKNRKQPLDKPDADKLLAVKPVAKPVAKVNERVAGMYREGDVVYAPNKSKLTLSTEGFITGTVILINGGEAWVIDTHGELHISKLGELGKVA